MYKFLKNLSCVLCLILIFGGCRKKAFDDYYNPPANLAPPIYQVLQGIGRFNTLLAVIDKSGYKPTLSASGYWTFFAPNDAAFQKYFTANNTSLAQMDSITAVKIVTYCLVYNAFTTDHLADFQSPTGYVPADAYKRRTAYHDTFQIGAGPDGATGVWIPENRTPFGSPAYLFGDQNNKFIPYFYSTFMAAKGLTAADYNYFFPATTYTGFNVVNATVVTPNLVAQNGIINEIDQVVLPLPSIEQKLASNAQYSDFRNIYETYLTSYLVDLNYTRQYNTLTGKTNNVYVKLYNPALAFALGDESYLENQANNSQTDGYTLFAPINSAFTPYLNNTILEFYKTVPQLPINVLTDLMNAHMFQTTVWPSKFAVSGNTTNEPPRFDPVNNVIDRQFCSNGLFYGVNQVQQANVFSTVYARAYLDPAYSIMLRVLQLNGTAGITSPGLRYTIFMIPDAVFRAAGYDYNTATSAFQQTVNGVVTSGLSIQTALQRILAINTIPTPNNEMNDLSGDGIIESSQGEYVRWHKNTVSSAGTVEKNATLTVAGSRDYSNGRVYFLTAGYMDLANNTLATDISLNAGTATAQGPYYDFYNYLLNSNAYNPGATEIAGIQTGANYTIFIPTQAAMKQAVVDGYLPGTTTVVGGVKVFSAFNYKPTAVTDQAQVNNFILYHILNGITIAPDGKKGGTLGTAFPSLLKDLLGNGAPLIIFNNPTNFQVEDSQARFATLIAPNNNSYFPATSNYLANHALIHQINNYLRSPF